MTTKRQKEYGDFQTPDALASQVCHTIRNLGVSPKTIIEPTCGKGSFLKASAAVFFECPVVLGFDINPDYVQAATAAVSKADIRCEDFFKKDWTDTLTDLQDPFLIVGNPPWVTNSELSSLDSINLPIKSNAQRYNGLDALTGKSNFDISEWMLSHLLKCLSGREAVLAMLCKTSVARKVLGYAWKQGLQIGDSAMYLIDSAKYFDVSVTACLLVCILKPGAKFGISKVFPNALTFHARYSELSW